MSGGSTPIPSDPSASDTGTEHRTGHDAEHHAEHGAGHDAATGAGIESGNEDTRGELPRRRSLLAGLALLTAVLFLAAVGLGVYLFLAKSKEDNREDAVVAARQEVINLFTLDYKDLDPHVQRVLEGATGDFRRDFEERSPQLRELLVKSQVVSQGEVLAAAPVRVDDSSATVLVVVKGAVRNVAAPDGLNTTERIQVELEKKGDRWFTSSLEPVS